MKLRLLDPDNGSANKPLARFRLTYLQMHSGLCGLETIINLSRRQGYIQDIDWAILALPWRLVYT